MSESSTMDYGQYESTYPSYDSQRRDRLAEVVNDYLGDNDVPARRFYEHLVAEITEMADYHEGQLNKAKEMLDLINGTRFKDLEF